MHPYSENRLMALATKSLEGTLNPAEQREMTGLLSQWEVAENARADESLRNQCWAFLMPEYDDPYPRTDADW